MDLSKYKEAFNKMDYDGKTGLKVKGTVDAAA